jgi:hypothetical protein
MGMPPLPAPPPPYFARAGVVQQRELVKRNKREVVKEGIMVSARRLVDAFVERLCSNSNQRKDSEVFQQCTFRVKKQRRGKRSRPKVVK